MSTPEETPEVLLEKEEEPAIARQNLFKMIETLGLQSDTAQLLKTAITCALVEAESTGQIKGMGEVFKIATRMI